MKINRVRPIVLAVVFGLAGLYALFGILGAAPAQAIGPMTAGVEILIFDDDQVSMPMLDDMGNLNGYAETHSGTVACSGNSCDGSITLVFTSTRGVVGFSYGTAIPVTDTAEAKARGTGSIVMGPRQGETFTFTATYQDNEDGTVSAKYEASRTDASFTLPKTPGSIRFD